MAKKRRRVKKRRAEYRPSLRERMEDFHPLRDFHPVRSIFRTLRLHKSLYVIAIILLVLLIAGGIAYKYINDNYTVTNIYVTGNTHYTNDEIIDMVLDDKPSHNSLFLSLKYRDKSIENIHFID